MVGDYKILAKRLKKLREEKELSHEKLKAVLEAQYGLKISKDSLINYEVSDDKHVKAGSSMAMRVEYLYCFADFYGVTLDYLVGKTDNKTPEPVLQNAAAYMGLSDEAINNIREVTMGCDEKSAEQRKVLDQLFSAPEREIYGCYIGFWDFLVALQAYKAAAAADWIVDKVHDDLFWAEADSKNLFSYTDISRDVEAEIERSIRCEFLKKLKLLEESEKLPQAVRNRISVLRILYSAQVVELPKSIMLSMERSIINDTFSDFLYGQKRLEEAQWQTFEK